jgi:hypothetical protein
LDSVLSLPDVAPDGIEVPEEEFVRKNAGGVVFPVDPATWWDYLGLG